MISFIRKNQALLAYFPTPNCEKPYLYLQGEKPQSIHIEVEKKEVTQLPDFNPAFLPVPMDFDGTTIMWLEYADHSQTLRFYNVLTKATSGMELAGSEENKHAHMRILDADGRMLSVRSLKNVFLSDQTNFPGQLLYSHDHCISTYCFDDDRIVSVDLAAVIKVYNLKTREITIIHVTGLPNFPDTARNYKLFDMGYPYYMTVNGND
jgi:hypothetical protein